MDATNITSYKNSDGKLVKLTKTETKLVSKLMVGDNPETIQNKISGAIVKDVDPLGVALYDYVMGSMMAYERGLPGFNVKDFDNARYLFLKLWPSAYMELLD